VAASRCDRHGRSAGARGPDPDGARPRRGGRVLRPARVRGRVALRRLRDPAPESVDRAAPVPVPRPRPARDRGKHLPARHRPAGPPRLAARRARPRGRPVPGPGERPHSRADGRAARPARRG
jgi:hypothetical protein